MPQLSGEFEQVILYGYGPAQVGLDLPFTSCIGLAAPFETEPTVPAAHTRRRVVRMRAGRAIAWMRLVLTSRMIQATRRLFRSGREEMVCGNLCGAKDIGEIPGLVVVFDGQALEVRYRYQGPRRDKSRLGKGISRTHGERYG
uniref:Uncharacterized protein n=1 Tax=Candidatus Kentrum sp. TC TaxID=2126339 RepID=A0A451A4S5_9GAMM|nr:MAG: hypothetical protein BECKTC1821F_GA0114240_105223 [Candidatus Kentron sp. TC]